MSIKQKRMMVAAIFVILAILYIVFDIGQYINLATFQRIRGDLTSFLDTQPLVFIGVFFLLYAVVTASSVPLAAVLTIIGGALMGPILAPIVIIPAATVGSIGPYFAARFVIKDYIQKRFEKPLRSVNKGIEDSGTWYLLSARLSAIVPFSVLNLVCGVANIPLRSFVIGTFFGIIPGTAVFAYAGSQLGESTEAGTILRPGVLIALLALAAVPLIIRYFQKKLLKRVSKTHGKV
jgi:uncharacterized membrane protein YdjX (TVP38/TMEM64 family)